MDWDARIIIPFELETPFTFTAANGSAQMTDGFRYGIEECILIQMLIKVTVFLMQLLQTRDSTTL